MTSRVKRFFLEIKDFSKTVDLNLPENFQIILDDKDKYLSQIRVEKVWGVGKKMSAWLIERGINNARELRDMSNKQIKNK